MLGPLAFIAIMFLSIWIVRLDYAVMYRSIWNKTREEMEKILKPKEWEVTGDIEFSTSVYFWAQIATIIITSDSFTKEFQTVYSLLMALGMAAILGWYIKIHDYTVHKVAFYVPGDYLRYIYQIIQYRKSHRAIGIAVRIQVVSQIGYLGYLLYTRGPIW